LLAIVLEESGWQLMDRASAARKTAWLERRGDNVSLSVIVNSLK